MPGTFSDTYSDNYTGGINIVMWADNEQIIGNSAGTPRTIQFDLTIREIANPANSATFSREMVVAQGPLGP